MQYSMERFLNVRNANHPSFSPDGKRVSFLTEITGVPQVWTVSVFGGWPNQVTFHEERIQMAQYSPIDNKILFGMDTGGDERQQLSLITDDGEIISTLTRSPDVIHTFGAWSPDAKHISVASNSRHQAFFDIYLINLETAESRLVYQQDGNNFPVAWSPDGRYLVISHSDSNLYNNLDLLDLETHEITRLTDQFLAAYHSVHWDVNSSGLYLLCNKDREFKALAYLDVKTKDISYLQAPEWDVEMMAYSEKSGRIAYATNIEGYSQVAVLESRNGVPRVIGGLPRGVITHISWAHEGEWLVAAVGGDTNNSDIWLIDALKGQVRQLTFSARAGISRGVLTESQLVHYPSFDDRQIPAFFYIPKGLQADGDMPTLIFVHGGPEGQSRPNFNPIIQYFAHRGYAVFVPNVRGSTGYGRTYVHLDDVEKRMDSVRDLKYAVEWLVVNGYSNPARIAIMGGSYGGFMTLSAITTYPDICGAAAELYGIANFLTFMENTGPWRRQLRAVEYGDPEKDEALLKEISPIHYADDIDIPLIVVHGARDPRVPIGETEQIVESIKRRNGVVEYVRFEDEGHGIVKLHNRILAYTAIADFLDKQILVH